MSTPDTEKIRWQSEIDSEHEDAEIEQMMSRLRLIIISFLIVPVLALIVYELIKLTY